MDIFNLRSPLYLVGVLIMLPIIMVRGLQVGLIFLLCYCVYILLFKKKIYYNNVFIILFFLSLITVILLSLSGLNSSWKSVGQLGFCYFSIIVFFNLLLGNWETTMINPFIKGVKHGCLIQIGWSILQYLLYNFFSLDINNLVFRDLLHIMSNASRISELDHSISVSGLGWHPSLLVPIIILSYLFFDTIFLKLVLIFIVVVSKNSTCLFALLLCVILDALNLVFKKHKDINKKKLLVLLLGGVFFIFFILTQRNLILNFVASVNNLFDRLKVIRAGYSDDISTGLHYRYYSSFWKIFKSISLKNELFGFGMECSGYPYTITYGQFKAYGAWSTESDIINFIFSNGILWTVVFYIWQFYHAIKGSRISYKYTIFYSCIMICGFLYNNQFLWVIVIESVLAYCIDKKINIFVNNKGV